VKGILGTLEVVAGMSVLSVDWGLAAVSLGGLGQLPNIKECSATHKYSCALSAKHSMQGRWAAGWWCGRSVRIVRAEAVISIK
jgi:hypothetical protein